MKAEIEIEFRGKPINLPVDFDYITEGEMAVVDFVTTGTSIITDLLDAQEMGYLQRLAQKDYDHLLACHKQSRAG